MNQKNQNQKNIGFTGLLIMGVFILAGYGLSSFSNTQNNTFQFVIENAGSSYPDTTIYWVAVCQNSSGQYCHIDPNGNLIPMDTSDNNVVFGTGNNCNGSNRFADYSNRLSDYSSITFDNSLIINSAILYLSVGKFLPLCVHEDSNQVITYAPPSFENPSLQGYNLIFQAVEFAYNLNALQTLNINTTNVDEVGISVQLFLKDSTGTDSVGFTSNRNQLIDAFSSCVDTNFNHLIIPSNTGSDTLRILSPEHASASVISDMAVVNYFAQFYTAYIDSSWSFYNNKTITIYNNDSAYTGQLRNDTFWFNTGPVLGQGQYAFAKPTSDEVMSATGEFTQGDDNQKNIGKVLAAAIYRTVFLETPLDTYNSWCGTNMINKYFTNEPINYYSSLLIPPSIDGLVYSYAYSDVCKQSSSLASTTTESLTIKIMD